MLAGPVAVFTVVGEKPKAVRLGGVTSCVPPTKNAVGNPRWRRSASETTATLLRTSSMATLETTHVPVSLYWGKVNSAVPLTADRGGEGDHMAAWNCFPEGLTTFATN